VRTLQQTHTYAILDITCEAYQEIRARLVEAGYDHAIHGAQTHAGEVLDMFGVALSELEPPPVEVKTLPTYADPTPGTPTSLSFTCCSSPDVGLQPATELTREGAECAPTVEFLCHHCGAALLIIRHATQPDEYFRKPGAEPDTGGR
jgi:hypothetical protein